LSRIAARYDGVMGATDRETLDLEGKRALAVVLRALGSAHEVVSLGRYQLGESLGRGACGEVFSATDPTLGREVAIKVVRARVDHDGSAQTRLVREAQALARVQHDNVVEVFDVGTQSGSRRDAHGGVYIVMEHLRGETLDAWAKRATPPAIVAAYAAAARGLAAAHRQGVVHRDFKPSNAMVTDAGRVVVLDFGLASAWDDAVSLRDSDALGDATVRGSGDARSLTRTGTVMGTPRYMSPEQHAAEPVEAAADQYAWCVALWEALTFAPPFSGRTIGELAAAKRQGPPPRADAIEASLHRVLARGLHPDPSARFPSMDALLAALLRRRGPRRWVWAGGLVAMLAGAGLWKAQAPPPIDLCETPDDAVAWPATAEHVATVEGDLLAAGIHPRFVGDHVVGRIERFGRQWAQAREQVCAPAEVSPAAAQAGAACLDRARRRLAMAEADLETSAREHRGPWLSALEGLGSPLRCAGPDPDALFGLYPRDPVGLVQVRIALENSTFGHDRDIDPQVLDRALAFGDEIDDHALATHALARRAHALAMEQRDFHEAVQTASLAAWRAQGAGDDALAADVLPDMAFLLIANGAPDADTDALLGAAREIAAAIGDPPQLAVRLTDLEGLALERRDDLVGARDKYIDNVAVLSHDPPPGLEYLLAQSFQRLGELESRLGNPWTARRWLQRALQIPRDPHAVYDAADQAGLKIELSRAAFHTGDYEAAATNAREALDAYERSTAEDPWGHQLAARGWYGHVIAVRGELESGRQLLRQSCDETRKREQRPLLRGLLHEHATIEALAGDHAAAVASTRELRALMAEHPGYGDEDMAEIWARESEQLTLAGRPDEAAAALAQGRRAAARRPTWEPGDQGPPPPSRLAIARAQARLSAAADDWPEARDATLTALEDPTLYVGTPMASGDLGELYHLLAQALLATEAHDEARQVAALADAQLARADPTRRDRARRSPGT
jgi:tetratricopeptide (TPR) repeat protein